MLVSEYVEDIDEINHLLEIVLYLITIGNFVEL